MPVLSAFTPCGQLACSSAKSHVQQFYELLPTLWGSELDFSIGTPYDEPKLYAVARMLALALAELEHAGNQAYPVRSFDLLPLLEMDFGLVPGSSDTVQTRQAALAAAELLPRGEIASNVTNALRAILGAAFFAYVPGPGAGLQINPLTAANWQDVRVAPRLLKLLDPVVQVGSWGVGYANFDSTIVTTETLFPGDKLMVGAGNTATMELVTVTATGVGPTTTTIGSGNWFIASFTKPHGVGDPVLAGNFPYWWCTKRTSCVVASTTAAQSQTLRRLVSVLMSKIARAVEMFSIVQPTSTTSTGGTIGPLTVGSPMGVQTVGAVNYLNSM